MFVVWSIKESNSVECRLTEMIGFCRFIASARSNGPDKYSEVISTVIKICIMVCIVVENRLLSNSYELCVNRKLDF